MSKRGNSSKGSKSNATTSSDSSNFSFVPQNAVTISTPILQKKKEDSTFIGTHSVTFPDRNKFSERRFAKSQYSTPNKHTNYSEKSSKFSNFSEPGSSSTIGDESDTKSSRFSTVSEPMPFNSNLVSSSTNSSKFGQIPEDSETLTSFPSTSSSKKSSFIAPISEDSHTISNFSKSVSSAFGAIPEDSKTRTSFTTKSSVMSPVYEGTSSIESSGNTFSKSSRISKISSVDQSPISSRFAKTSTQIPSSLLPLSQILGEEEEEDSDEENTETIIGNSKHEMALEEEEEEEEYVPPKSQKKAHFVAQPIIEEEEEEEEVNEVIKTPTQKKAMFSPVVNEETKKSSSFAKPRTPYRNESEALQDDVLRSSGNEKSIFTPSKSSLTPRKDESEVEMLKRQNAVLLQSLQKLGTTILESFDIYDSPINPDLFAIRSPEKIAQDAEKLCAIQQHEVKELKDSAEQAEVSEDVKELANSVSERIKGYEKALQKQHKELISLLK